MVSGGSSHFPHLPQISAEFLAHFAPFIFSLFHSPLEHRKKHFLWTEPRVPDGPGSGVPPLLSTSLDGQLSAALVDLGGLEHAKVSLGGGIESPVLRRRTFWLGGWRMRKRETMGPMGPRQVGEKVAKPKTYLDRVSSIFVSSLILDAIPKSWIRDALLWWKSPGMEASGAILALEISRIKAEEIIATSSDRYLHEASQFQSAHS